MNAADKIYAPNDHMVIMVGCFDTKAKDFEYLYSCLVRNGVQVTAVNVGVMDTTARFPVDFNSEQVALAGGSELIELRKRKDREFALEVMGKGAANILAQLVSKNKVDGVIGMGGGGGTFLVLKAMGSVPFGIPKVCLSTIATKDLSDKIGDKDVVLIPSIVDVAGLNSISRILISQAAAALYGMMKSKPIPSNYYKGSIAISVFGNTSLCAEKCSEILRAEGYDMLSFHAVGSGGKTMESLTTEELFDAVVDLTTTELADELCGGICSAGPDRMTAAGKMGIPQVIVPGCLDMVNFGAMDTVPVKYKNRKLFSWAPDVTLMRTNKEENTVLGRNMAEKMNASKGPVTVLFPLRGLSKIGGEGEFFHDPEIDRALFKSIEYNIRSDIRTIRVDENIDTVEFAQEVSRVLLDLMKENV